MEIALVLLFFLFMIFAGGILFYIVFKKLEIIPGLANRIEELENRLENKKSERLPE